MLASFHLCRKCRQIIQVGAQEKKCPNSPKPRETAAGELVYWWKHWSQQKVCLSIAPAQLCHWFLPSLWLPLSLSQSGGAMSKLFSLPSVTMTTGHCKHPEQWRLIRKQRYFTHLHLNTQALTAFTDSLTCLPPLFFCQSESLHIIYNVTVLNMGFWWKQMAWLHILPPWMEPM